MKNIEINFKSIGGLLKNLSWLFFAIFLVLLVFEVMEIQNSVSLVVLVNQEPAARRRKKIFTTGWTLPPTTKIYSGSRMPKILPPPVALFTTLLTTSARRRSPTFPPLPPSQLPRPKVLGKTLLLLRLRLPQNSNKPASGAIERRFCFGYNMD